MKLGLFGANIDGSLCATTAPGRFSLSWANTLRAAQIADEAGFDFNVPLARWTPLTPTSNYCGTSFETITWASAVAARTRRIQIFATVHAPFVHPAVAAKQIATIDQISGGRAGVNIVLNASDLSLLDHKSPPQAEKYGSAAEWTERVIGLWERPELAGFSPAPLQKPRPPIMNAGMSEESGLFAARYADVALRRIDSRNHAGSAAEFGRIKDAARGHGRSIEIVAPVFVLCRPSRAEAQKRFEEAFTDFADAEYTARLKTDGLSADEVRRMHAGFGHEALVGAPEDIADGLERVAALGVDGVGLFFLDYLAELPFFTEAVLPLLAKRGLRAAPAPQPAY